MNMLTNYLLIYYVIDFLLFQKYNENNGPEDDWIGQTMKLYLTLTLTPYILTISE